MKYTFRVYYEKWGETFGATWYCDANSVAEAIGHASKVCEALMHGKKINKRQGKLVFSIPKKMED